MTAQLCEADRSSADLGLAAAGARSSETSGSPRRSGPSRSSAVGRAAAAGHAAPPRSRQQVGEEIRNARQADPFKEKRRKLFPIRLVDFDTLRDWECFDSDSGKDLGVEIREYFIPDFSNWKDHDSFETAFGRLIKDLKATTSTDEKTKGGD